MADETLPQVNRMDLKCYSRERANIEIREGEKFMSSNYATLLLWVNYWVILKTQLMVVSQDTRSHNGSVKKCLQMTSKVYWPQFQGLQVSCPVTCHQSHVRQWIMGWVLKLTHQNNCPNPCIVNCLRLCPLLSSISFSCLSPFNILTLHVDEDT